MQLSRFIYNVNDNVFVTFQSMWNFLFVLQRSIFWSVLQVSFKRVQIIEKGKYIVKVKDCMCESKWNDDIRGRFY